MKKSILIIFTIIFLISCKNEEQQSAAKFSQHLLKDNLTNLISYAILNRNLVIEILDFIDHCDSIAFNNKSIDSANIFSISIFDYRNTCSLIISKSPYYSEDKMLGYLIIKNRMIEFCQNNSVCNKKLFNEIFLLKGRNDNYLEIKSCIDLVYEPYSRIYEIINGDSLKLLKQGYRLNVYRYFDRIK